MPLLRKNRRNQNRYKCVVEARVYSESCPGLVCTIEDITPEGAKLRAPESIGACNKILVFMPAIGEFWAAQVRWRRQQTFGVQFIHKEADLSEAKEIGSPDIFAMRLQAAQAALTAHRLSQRIKAEDLGCLERQPLRPMRRPVRGNIDRPAAAL